MVSIMSGKLSFHDCKSQGILLQKTCRSPGFNPQPKAQDMQIACNRNEGLHGLATAILSLSYFGLVIITLVYF